MSNTPINKLDAMLESWDHSGNHSYSMKVECADQSNLFLEVSAKDEKIIAQFAATMDHDVVYPVSLTGLGIDWKAQGNTLVAKSSWDLDDFFDSNEMTARFCKLLKMMGSALYDDLTAYDSIAESLFK